MGKYTGNTKMFLFRYFNRGHKQPYLVEECSKKIRKEQPKNIENQKQ